MRLSNANTRALTFSSLISTSALYLQAADYSYSTFSQVEISNSSTSRPQKEEAKANIGSEGPQNLLTKWDFNSLQTYNPLHLHTAVLSNQAGS